MKLIEKGWYIKSVTQVMDGKGGQQLANTVLVGGVVGRLQYRDVLVVLPLKQLLVHSYLLVYPLIFLRDLLHSSLPLPLQLHSQVGPLFLIFPIFPLFHIFPIFPLFHIFHILHIIPVQLHSLFLP